MPHKPLIKSRYSSGGNFTRGNPTISHKIWLENYSSEILFNYTVILFQYGRFPECMIITYWRRLWALWKAECIYVYFLGYCSILPVFMDFHTPINPLISFPIKMIYCIIMIFIIFSHNKLSVGFSSALKRNWKGIDKKELELELITRRSENDNTPQPLDQWTNSPFIGQQVGNCKSFTLTHYLADLFAMHRGPRSISFCIQNHIQLTSLSFQVSRPSHS